MIDLQSYMAESIRRIMGNAYRSVLGNPREARFVMRMQRAVHRSERRRRTLMEGEGLQVPPFLIASIATACNLQCKGCYARKNGIASERPTKPTLTAEQWGRIFAEAEGLGVNFCLLAGGEPLTRRDILEQAAAVKDIIFPVFTNGTMIGATYTEFFRKHLNMVPVISLEGDAADTDTRRGEGIYRRVMEAMDTLQNEKLFFGTSITVTTENYRRVTSEEYLRELHGKGCRMVFYVEYVPFDENTRHLAFGDDDV
ncbi:MAG: radical SAM protein, partial [Selenomonas sp.]|nr:radical SAM protein [Selenomonas sp.]